MNNKPAYDIMPTARYTRFELLCVRLPQKSADTHLMTHI